MRSEIDHLVVACADLDQGSAWAQETLGADPVPGGKHATMGTHNRLLKLGPRVYLELIAIDPDAPAPARPRWFDLDNADVQARAAESPFLLDLGPRRPTDIFDAVVRVPALGEVTPFTRNAYAWKFALPEEGRLNFGGVLPALIEWNSDHPAAALPDSGCELLALDLAHPAAASIVPLFRALKLMGPVDLKAGPRALTARLRTPRGEIALG
ncbi:MAG: VOC family protein [Burkholderiaceae bacterium]|nr:VOC family protein [Burkholderiaceae bacterium]